MYVGKTDEQHAKSIEYDREGCLSFFVLVLAILLWGG
jgi:hypothetical protein